MYQAVCYKRRNCHLFASGSKALPLRHRKEDLPPVLESSQRKGEIRGSIISLGNRRFYSKMKRRAAVLGKRGSGNYTPEQINGKKRPPGQVRPIISKSKHGKPMTHFHDNENDLPDFDGARRIVTGCIWLCAIIAVFSIAMCSATVAHGQEVFRFNTITVMMQDTSGETTVGSTSWPIWAHGDTLSAGPLLWWGLKWEVMDSGAMYCATPFFQAKYSPGPGGKALMVRPAGAIKVMEFYERETLKGQ
jgi:hypothetical protein